MPMKRCSSVSCNPAERKAAHVLGIWIFSQIAVGHIIYSRINLQPHSVNTGSGKYSSVILPLDRLGVIFQENSAALRQLSGSLQFSCNRDLLRTADPAGR